MLRAIWRCSNCNHTKTTEYKNDAFDKARWDEFIHKSKHLCKECNQLAMTIQHAETTA